jgi:hypothetical protein
MSICSLLCAGTVSGQSNDVVQVTIKTPTNKLQNSIDFYTKLGFQEAGSPLAFTDGKVIIAIDTVKSARAGFNFYKPSWAAEVTALKATTNVIKTKTGYMVSDPSGVWIYLVESIQGVPRPADTSFSLLGNYQGVTLESGNVVASYALYTTLGLQLVKGSAEKGFVTISNGRGFTITLMGPRMCPHLFFNPSLTYFNGKRNLGIINKIKQLGFQATQDITWFNEKGEADNIILRDPGGYGFFIFSD